MTIKTPGEAIDRLGGTVKVSKWLDVEPHTVSGWRKRGISRNFAMHFFAELSERQGCTLKPQVFGLADWGMVLMPDLRRAKLKRVA